MFSIFNNIPTVTKNILILNILFYFATLMLMQSGINLIQLFGAHYLNTPLFEPYQVVTHFFMHSTQIFHILFNMLMLVMFGSHLERIWGPKRFFIFYIASAVGAFALYNGIGVYQIIEIKKKLIDMGYDIVALNTDLLLENYKNIKLYTPDSEILLQEYASKFLRQW
jgi:membrane associated rhomboid family serine protease